jgi:hypothetical protein
LGLGVKFYPTTNDVAEKLKLTLDNAPISEKNMASLYVIGFVASPRKGMNTDTLVERVLEGAKSVGADTEKIYLNDLDMKPCQACAEYPAPKFCWYEDHFEQMLRGIIWSRMARYFSWS